MTDNEIIKALECCDSYFDCDGCPCEKTCGGLNVLTKNTLDLINRQKAEIDILIRKKGTLRDEISELRAEIERLKEERIERIRELTRTVYDKEIAEAKSEAIKEFAERLKEYTYDIVLYGEIVTVSQIDSLVKEMTEQ